MSNNTLGFKEFIAEMIQVKETDYGSDLLDRKFYNDKSLGVSFLCTYLQCGELYFKFYYDTNTGNFMFKASEFSPSDDKFIGDRSMLDPEDLNRMNRKVNMNTLYCYTLFIIQELIQQHNIKKLHVFGLHKNKAMYDTLFNNLNFIKELQGLGFYKAKSRQSYHEWKRD
jgi:hypothetical protein